MDLIRHTLSLLTSSTQRPLNEIASAFRHVDGDDAERQNSLELYLLREPDLGYLPDGNYGPADGIARLIGRLKDDQIDPLADEIRKQVQEMPITGLATYYPEITSADLNRREDAIKALVNAVRIANRLKVTRVEMVGGRHDEECTRRSADNTRDCEIVLSFRDHVGRADLTRSAVRRVIMPRMARPMVIPTKIEWLIGGLYEVHRRLSDYRLEYPVQLFLEVEPGPLFVLSRRRLLNHVLRATSDLRVPGHNRPFIGFNCDIGHLLVMTSREDVHPSTMWRESLDALNRPLERVGNFHISRHPYHRVHLDHAPTTNPDFAIPAISPSDSYEYWSVPVCFVPWLNCVLCVSEQCPDNPANVSLELEAVARDEPAREGLKSVRNALDAIQQLRMGDVRWGMDGCGGCPLHPD